MARLKKVKKEEPPPPFPNEFWEHILLIRATQPRRYALFSVSLKLSAQIYEQQRNRSITLRRKAAA